jgi:hypothetical protein
LSAKLNISIGIGTLAVMLVMTISVLYFTRAGVEQSEQNSRDIDNLEKKFNNFVAMWTERIHIGNINTNNTQLKIDAGVQNVLGNLSSHRHVTNETFAKIEQILNTTTALTSDEYNKQAEKKVNNIIGNLSKEHEIIFKALNITTKDNSTDAEDELANIKKAIQVLENRTSQE